MVAVNSGRLGRVVRLRVGVAKAVAAPVAPAFLRRVLVAAASEPRVVRRLPAEAEVEVEVTVRVTGDRELRRLNGSFLGEDAATDVLSFPTGDGGAGGYLGDIALSWPAVERQAGLYGHAPLSEAALLCVHGLLHLLGWDHATLSEEGDMVRVTHACLDLAGVSLAERRLAL
jgi:probable rRNA maturation factor